MPTHDAAYRKLFECVPIGLYRSTPDGRVVDVNPELVRMLGYPDRDSLLDRSAETFYADPESRDRWRSEMEATGTVVGFEAQWLKQDGSTIWVEEDSHAFRSADGAVLYYEGSARDVTARREADERLAEEKERFEQLFAASPEAVVLCANDATVLRVNAEFTKLFGYTEEEAIGQDIDKLVAEGLNGLHEHANQVTESVADGKTASVETKRRHKDGHLIDVSILGRAIRTDGKQVALYAIYRDITERVAMEQQLALRKERFEQLFAASPEAVAICKNNGTVIRVNGEFTRVFGYTAEEAAGQNIDKLVAEGLNGLHEHATQVTESVAGGKTEAVETKRRHKDGHLIDVSILGRAIHVNGVQAALYAIYRDISARVEAEDALAATRQKVERLHEAADALGEAEEEDQVYRITVDAAERILGFSLGALWITAEDGFVCAAASSGVDGERLKQETIDITGVAAQSIEDGRPIIAADPSVESLPDGVLTSPQSLICAPLGDIGLYLAASPEPSAFTEEDGRLLGILLGHSAVAAGQLRLQAELVRQARHDALTGVFNRHYFNELIAQEVLRSSRYDHPIGLLMIDVDRFKEINDRYGHQTGDMVLKEIASTLRETVRATDMIVRYGGDEFLVMLTETGEDAERAAIRIRDAVRSNEKLRAISRFDVTVSVGSIFWHPGDDYPIEEALAKADERMYEDKRKS